MKKLLSLNYVISLVVTFIVVIPVAALSYIWQAVLVAWAYGEYLYNPNLFDKRYGQGKDKGRQG